MSGFKIEEILERIAEKYDCKIWLAKRIGKRLAYINGMKAGRERFLPAEKIYEKDNIVVFAEGLKKPIDEIHDVLEKAVEKFVNKEVNSKT